MNSDVIMGLSKSLAWSAQHINNNLSSLLKGSKRDQVHIGSKDAVDLAIAGCTQSSINVVGFEGGDRVKGTICASGW